MGKKVEVLPTTKSVTPIIRSDRSTPNIVLARDVIDHSKNINLHVNPKAIEQFDADELLAKLGEYHGLVHGNIPGGVAPSGLFAATAIFKGVRRPCLETNFDTEVYIFITNPSATYSYAGVPKYTTKSPNMCDKPHNSVFATYVRLYPDTETAVKESGLPESYCIKGVILDWEWVLADEENDKLPEDHSNRYDSTIWTRD